MDRFEQIAADAQLSVCILGNPKTSDFEYLSLNVPGPLPEDVRRDFMRRGFVFVAVVGIVHGSPVTALAVPLDERTMSALAEGFLAYLEVVLNAGLKPKDDFVKFAEGLMRLEDPRD